jgi:hypothetical protein
LWEKIDGAYEALNLSLKGAISETRCDSRLRPGDCGDGVFSLAMISLFRRTYKNIPFTTGGSTGKPA